MLMKVKGPLFGLCLVLLVSACSQGFEESMVNIKDNDKTLERMGELQKSAGFDFSKITVARIEIDGEKFQITSLRPEKLSAGGKGNASVTLMLFNDKHDKLIFFTRDGQKKIGYEIQLPLADFERKKEILFPVVDVKSGQVADKTISLINLKSR